MMLKTIPQWLRAAGLTRLQAGAVMRKLCARVLNLGARRAQADVEHAAGRQDTAALTESFAAFEHAITIDDSRSIHWRGEVAISALFSVAIVLKLASQYFPLFEPPAEQH
jgi:hypothetical protein